MVLIVDLDDTLVSSTKLNNDAYNFALEKYGYDRLKTAGRITREKLKWLDNQKISDKYIRLFGLKIGWKGLRN